MCVDWGFGDEQVVLGGEEAGHQVGGFGDLVAVGVVFDYVVDLRVELGLVDAHEVDSGDELGQLHVAGVHRVLAAEVVEDGFGALLSSSWYSSRLRSPWVRLKYCWTRKSLVLKLPVLWVASIIR